MQKNSSIVCTNVLPRLGTALTRLFTVKNRFLMCLNNMYSPNVHFSIAVLTIKKALFSESGQENIYQRAQLSPTSVSQRWDNITAITQSVVCLLRPFVGTFRPVEEMLFPVSKLL